MAATMASRGPPPEFPGNKIPATRSAMLRLLRSACGDMQLLRDAGLKTPRGRLGGNGRKDLPEQIASVYPSALSLLLAMTSSGPGQNRSF